MLAEKVLATRHLQGHHGSKGGHPGKGNTKFDKRVDKVMSNKFNAIKKNMTKAGLTRRFVNEADVRQMPEVMMDTLERIILEDDKSENRMKAIDIMSKYTMIPSQEVVVEENDNDVKSVLKQLAKAIEEEEEE